MFQGSSIVKLQSGWIVMKITKFLKWNTQRQENSFWNFRVRCFHKTVESKGSFLGGVLFGTQDNMHVVLNLYTVANQSLKPFQNYDHEKFQRTCHICLLKVNWLFIYQSLFSLFLHNDTIMYHLCFRVWWENNRNIWNVKTTKRLWIYDVKYHFYN